MPTPSFLSLSLFLSASATFSRKWLNAAILTDVLRSREGGCIDRDTRGVALKLPFARTLITRTRSPLKLCYRLNYIVIVFNGIELLYNKFSNIKNDALQSICDNIARIMRIDFSKMAKKRKSNLLRAR